MTLTVVTGGTRSGKSARAEALAAATGLPVRYVATGDASMGERIAAHVARRPAEWTTVEVGDGSLAAAIGDVAADTCVLVDGLGPWIATRLHLAGAFEDAARLPAVGDAVLGEVDGALAALEAAETAIVVAEQAGSGVLPMDATSRAWLDVLGAATQRFADAASVVELVVAGRVFHPTDAPGPIVGAPEAPGPIVRASDPAGSARVPGNPAGSAPVPGNPAGSAPVPGNPAGSAPVPGQPDASLRRHGDRDVRPGDADHAVNVVAGGPPRWLRAALDEALDGGAAQYPREDEAIAALAQLHGRDPDCVVPTNGGAEALWLLGPALRPTHAAVVHPQFTEAEAALHAHGIPVTRVHRDASKDFALDPQAVPDDADLVIVGNPASPSGTLDPATAVLALRRPGRTVVVDEAFMDLVPGEPGSLAREALDDVIVVRSLTKVLSIPGLRAGYALASPTTAARLKAVRPPWSANALALAALTAAAQQPHELHAIAETAALHREDLTEKLRTIDGLHLWPGAANFVLVQVADGPATVARLREHAIAVRPAASFPGLGANHIRITARTPEQNARLVEVLSTC